MILSNLELAFLFMLRTVSLELVTFQDFDFQRKKSLYMCTSIFLFLFSVTIDKMI